MTPMHCLLSNQYPAVYDDHCIWDMYLNVSETPIWQLFANLKHNYTLYDCKNNEW